MYQVYKITCATNGKVYIGYTSKGINARFQVHINNAKWRRAGALYDAIRVHGSEAFSVELLEECEHHADACALEVRHIEACASVVPSGYNMTTGGDGVPITEDAIRRAAEKKRGRFTEKQAEAAARRKGKSLSAEHREKLSNARKGVAKSESWKLKMRETSERKRAEREAMGWRPKKSRRSEVLTAEMRSEIMREASLRRWARERDMEAAGSTDITWTPERREMKRVSATVQWTEDKKEAARQRALLYWEKKRSLENAPLVGGGHE